MTQRTIPMSDLAPMEYVGRGVFLIGVPMRDLTLDEVARLPDRIIRRLTSSGLYRPVRPSKPVTREVKPNV